LRGWRARRQWIKRCGSNYEIARRRRECKKAERIERQSTFTHIERVEEPRPDFDAAARLRSRLGWRRWGADVKQQDANSNE
jgi:hypothetical protein